MGGLAEKPGQVPGFFCLRWLRCNRQRMTQSEGSEHQMGVFLGVSFKIRNHKASIYAACGALFDSLYTLESAKSHRYTVTGAPA